MDLFYLYTKGVQDLTGMLNTEDTHVLGLVGAQVQDVLKNFEVNEYIRRSVR